MLKTTVNNGTEQLWFEEEVSEAGAVDGYVGPLHLLLVRWGPTLRGSLRLLILLIVQKFIINVVLSHLFVLHVNWEGLRNLLRICKKKKKKIG